MGAVAFCIDLMALLFTFCWLLAIIDRKLFSHCSHFCIWRRCMPYLRAVARWFPLQSLSLRYDSSTCSLNCGVKMRRDPILVPVVGDLVADEAIVDIEAPLQFKLNLLLLLLFIKADVDCVGGSSWCVATSAFVFVEEFFWFIKPWFDGLRQQLSRSKLFSAILLILFTLCWLLLHSNSSFLSIKIFLTPCAIFLSHTRRTHNCSVNFNSPFLQYSFDSENISQKYFLHTTFLRYSQGAASHASHRLDMLSFLFFFFSIVETQESTQIKLTNSGDKSKCWTYVNVPLSTAFFSLVSQKNWLFI